MKLIKLIKLTNRIVQFISLHSFVSYDLDGPSWYFIFDWNWKSPEFRKLYPNCSNRYIILLALIVATVCFVMYHQIY